MGRKEFRKNAAQIDARFFDTLVEQAVADLPKDFRDALHNISIIVEDEPGEEYREDDDDDRELLGLYLGVPLPERGYGESPLLPDQIVIFRGPLQRMSRSRSQLREEIRITLFHELAHYFGFDEDDLRERGLD